MSTAGLLKKIYYDLKNPQGYSSISELFHVARKKKKNLTLEQVENFLSKQNVYSLYKPVITKFPKRKTLAKKVDYLWQTDLMSLIPLARYNNQNQYIMVVIDVLSRYAWAEPIKRKTGKEVVRAFKKILSKSKRKPLKIQSDKGGEYHNHEFKHFCLENGIVFYSSHSDYKASLAERLIRTLKSKIYKAFYTKNTLRYYDFLDQIMHAYNHRKHGSHKFRPVDVDKRNEKKVWRILFKDYLNSPLGKPDFKIGQKVRIALSKSVFNKSYKQSFTSEIFSVSAINKTRPLTYKIQDNSGEELLGSFYPQELSKVN